MLYTQTISAISGNVTDFQQKFGAKRFQGLIGAHAATALNDPIWATCSPGHYGSPADVHYWQPQLYQGPPFNPTLGR